MDYKPSAGQKTEAWPQQMVGNQIPADASDGALVFISPPLTQATTVFEFHLPLPLFCSDFRFF